MSCDGMHDTTPQRAVNSDAYRAAATRTGHPQLAPIRRFPVTRRVRGEESASWMRRVSSCVATRAISSVGCR